MRAYIDTNILVDLVLALLCLTASSAWADDIYKTHDVDSGTEA